MALQIRRNFRKLGLAARLHWGHDEYVDFAQPSEQVLHGANVTNCGIRCDCGVSCNAFNIKRCVRCGDHLALGKAREAACIVQGSRRKSPCGCERLDSDDACAVDAPFDHGADKPACAAQLHIGFVQNRLSVATRQPVELPFAKGRGGGIIAGPRLGVDRLHARQKRSGKRQPRQKRKELQRIAKPMAEQRREGHADHAT